MSAVVSIRVATSHGADDWQGEVAMSEIAGAKEAWDFLTQEELVAKREQFNMSCLSLMHEYYNELVSGSRSTHYLEYFKQKYVEPKGKVRIASLGCGTGHLERHLAQTFRYDHNRIDGYDISPELVKHAREQAASLGIDSLEYFEADLDQIQLPESEYDLVIFFHSLHHVENLEGALQQAESALAPNGLLLVVDFVGPTRFQWIAQEMLELLPDRLRIYLPDSREGHVVLKQEIARSRIEDVIRADPSEAVRSGDILSMLRERFAVVEEQPMGGTLLSILFQGVAGNFDESRDLDRSLILAFQKMEARLITEKVIPSDYVFMVLRRRSEATTPR